MKVNIGPSPEWWGPYQIADLLQKVGVSEERCESIGNWLSSKTWLEQLCQWVFDRRTRTEKISLITEDSWNVDRNIGVIMLPLLKVVKEHKAGVPVNLDIEEGMPEDILPPAGFVSEGYWDLDENVEARWLWILNEIEWAMNELATVGENEPKMRGGDHSAIDEYNARLTRGTTLFGKYLRSINT